MDTLPLEDIQGFILRGYAMDCLRLFVLRVADAASARLALGKLPIASGTTWAAAKPDACVNVAFTFAGLQALGLSAESLASFPEEFRQGAVARAAIVGDTGQSDPSHWMPALAAGGVHVLVTLFAQTQEIREDWANRLREIWKGGAFAEALTIDANILPGNVAHFGYRDGYSQPTIEGGLTNLVPEPPQVPPSPAGEFLLGYPSQFTGYSYTLPEPAAELGMNGSFMALRILEQDCAAFERLLRDAPAQFGMDGELLAAKMVGRWRNGVPLELSAETDSPVPAIPLEGLNAYDYTADMRGNRCPIGSHMRRNNPRNSPIAGGGGLKHRIVRRGLPYGPPYDPSCPDDGIERGLLGIFIGASIKDQFEFLMKEWVNGDLFAPGIGGTKDPILGDNSGGAGRFVIPAAARKPAVVVTGFARLVETRGGAYAFLPGLRGIRYIAGL